jgi:hypothetical protein
VKSVLEAQAIIASFWLLTSTKLQNMNSSRSSSVAPHHFQTSAKLDFVPIFP